MTNAAKLAPLPPKEAPAPRPEGAGAADNGGGGPRVSHNVTKDEKDVAAKQAAGTDTFELVGVADFVAPEQALTVRDAQVRSIRWSASTRPARSRPITAWRRRASGSRAARTGST